MRNDQSCNACGRREFLSMLGGLGAGHLASSALGPAAQAVFAAERTLRDLAAQKGLLYGCATTQDALSADASFASTVAQQCSLLVPENALNWKYVEFKQGQYDFHRGDWVQNFAQSHNMKFGGATLVWHDALPPWITSLTPQDGRDIMTNHVRQTVSHYRGKAFSWGVVNEAIAFRDAHTDLKDTPFLRLVGPDYIEIAFRTAAEADPGALLIYNDNHLEYDVPEDENRRAVLLGVLKRLVSRRVPVGALGIQSHLRTGNVPFNANKLKDFLSRVADLGLKIEISELDVTEKGPESQVSDRDDAVAREIDRYLGVVLQQPAVIGVVTWGLSAKYSWLRNYAPRPDGQPVRPLPYDSDMRPTRAWDALASAFDRAPRRSPISS